VRHLTVQQISASLDGALSGVSLELVVRHLSSCHECRERHARLTKQDDALRRLLACEFPEVFFDDMLVRLGAVMEAESHGQLPPEHALPPELPPLGPEKPPTRELPRPPGGATKNPALMSEAEQKRRAAEELKAAEQAAMNSLEELMRELRGAQPAHAPAAEPPDAVEPPASILALPPEVLSSLREAAARPDPSREAAPGPAPVEPAPEAQGEPLGIEPVGAALPAEPVEPEPEPVVLAPEPEPVVLAPEPEPVVFEPEPEPVVLAPEPEPVVLSPEPEPVVLAPEPEPVVFEPEPEPVALSPEPEPVAFAPELEPVAFAPQPEIAPEPEPPSVHVVELERIHVPAPAPPPPTPRVEPAGTRQPEPARAPNPVDDPYADYEDRLDRAPRAHGRYRPPRRVRKRHLAGAAAAVAVLLVALGGSGYLPAVIRVPVPELPRPRVPRIEVVRVPLAPPERPTPGAEPAADPASRPRADATIAPVRDDAPRVVKVPRPAAPSGTALAAPRTEREPAREPARREATAARPEPGPSRPTPAARTPEPAIPAPAVRTPEPVRPQPGPPTTPAQARPDPPAPATMPAAEPEVDTGASWPLLCGQVVDETGAPVVGARVTLADLDLGARTDRRGRFCIAAPPGDRTLSVVAAGFAAHRRVVSLGAENLEVAIALAPAP